MDRLSSMTAFVKVADAGSFSAAADLLQISAPMVGKHVRFLEERLGVLLISRTTRRQSLTEAGLTYLEHCRAILADIAIAEAVTSEHLATPRGRLRITAPTLLGRHCVVPALLQAIADLPDLKLEVVLTDEFLDLDDCDLAVRSLAVNRSEVPGGAGLATRRVCSHTMVVCCAPSYMQRHGRSHALSDLSGHATIAFGRSGRCLPWTFSTPDGALSRFQPAGRIIMDDLEAIADAAVAGFGLAWLPSWLVRTRIHDGALIELSLDSPGMGYENHVLWHEGGMTAKVRYAVDTLVKRLPHLM